jgi:hypothetical protein
MWWDREVDDQGRLLRTDVRQAAHQLWPEAVRRTRRMISDPAEAAELIEITVVYISHHLDRTNAPQLAENIPSLLSLHFSQELRRLAKRLGRIILVGDNSAIEALAVVEDWAERINRHHDFEKAMGYLRPRTRILVYMRLELHSWELIGAKLGKRPATLRKEFWKELHEVLSRMNNEKGSEEKGSEK